MRTRLGLPFCWGRDIHPFCGDWSLHFGLLHFSGRLSEKYYQRTARANERMARENEQFWGIPSPENKER